jgi:hypothetical protein
LTLFYIAIPIFARKSKKNNEDGENWDKDMNPWEKYQVQTELVNFNNTSILIWGAEIRDYRSRK